MDFESLSPKKQQEVFYNMMEKATMLFFNSQDQFERQGLPLDMVLLGQGVQQSVVNTPLIKKIEEPHRYVSPNGNRPFISYFATLQTRQEEIKEHIDAMAFFLDIAIDSLPRILSGSPMGKFDYEGTGINTRLQFFNPAREFVASASVMELLVAQYVLAENSSGQLLGFDDAAWQEIISRTFNEFVSMQKQKKVSGPKKKRITATQRLLSSKKTGRNDPCPCGSGRRFQAVLPEVEAI